MIDYKKLGRLFDSGDQSKIDTVINVDHRPLVSQYDNRFIKFGFVEHKDNKYILKMTKKERDIFQITKSIADDELKFAYDVISKILSDDTELKEIEYLKKQIPMIREEVQIEILKQSQEIESLKKIDKSHQELNGKLNRKISQLKKLIDLYKIAKVQAVEDAKKEADILMMKKIKELEEVKRDNKKLAEMNEKLTHTPSNLREKGIL